MYSESIGVLGGFGGYATLEFYKNFLSFFASESEINYPHIIFDNNFTMPSRTRALLYGECYDEILAAMVNSIKQLCSYQVKYIVLVCGTAHYFLDDIYKLLPEVKDKVINIIQATGDYINITRKGANKVFIIAAEGALHKGVYDKVLEPMGIQCVSPADDEFSAIRAFIEYVKKAELKKSAVDEFIKFISNRGTDEIILGCTEFSALLDYCYSVASETQADILNRFTFYDPMKIVLDKLKRILK